MIRFADTVIGAADVHALASYYEQLTGMMRLKEGGGEYVILLDLRTRQRLCIVPDPKRKPCHGLETEDFDGSLERIKALGGKVTETHRFPKMDLADCEDPSGNCFMIWHSK